MLTIHSCKTIGRAHVYSVETPLAITEFIARRIDLISTEVLTDYTNKNWSDRNKHLSRSIL